MVRSHLASRHVRRLARSRARRHRACLSLLTAVCLAWPPTAAKAAEPANTEPANTEPADTEPANTGPANTEPGNTEPDNETTP